ncbi:MAG: hypothetical protein IJ746_04720 [Ruminococcus sp.]|nr:hypothetical protein [Ruminococcus sp.]
MSWSNPTQQEAQEAYDAAKQRYDSAAEEYLLLSKQQETYTNQVAGAYQTYMEGEKRIPALRQLQFKLQRLLVMFKSGSGNIDSEIYVERSYRADLQSGLRRFVVCDGLASPTLGKATMSPFVDEDPDALRIRELAQAELTRVEDMIRTLEAQSRDFNSAYSDFAQNLTSYEEQRKELKKTMDSCTLEMEHYKKYI